MGWFGLLVASLCGPTGIVPAAARGIDARAGELTVYTPLPKNLYGSGIYDVTVSQGHKSLSSYVYESRREADNPYNKYNVFTTDANHWTSFSFCGSVTVKVKLRDGTSVRKAVVRPLSKEISATIADNAVTFTLVKPANLCVELDAARRDPLFIFANPPEIDVPTKGASQVIYFGPGVTDLGKEPFKVHDGETVYLAGGAYVKGRLETAGPQGRKPVTIRGRGILSGVDLNEKRGEYGQHMIDAVAHKVSATARRAVPELSVEGIVITDSPGCGLLASRRLTAENVKILAWSKCSDGIGGGVGSVIKGCFLKVNDDSIYFFRSGLSVIDNVVWVQAAGSALQMGWNVMESMQGARADGLDIIGDDPGKTHTDKDWINSCVVALMDLHNHTTYRSIVVENVRHEGKPYQLFGIRTKLAPENGPGLAEYREGLGSVDGMMFRNITAAQKPLHPAVFDGNGSEPGTIANVTFENLRIAGTLVTETNAAAYVVQRGKTSGFRYVATADQKPASRPAGKNFPR